VVALGGKTPTDIVEGAKEYAIPFRTLEDAYCLKEKLRNLENSDQETIRVAVVGGGYSGVELALKMADRLGEKGRIRIIDRNSDILTDSPTYNQDKAKKALSDRQIWLDLETEVVTVEPEQISLRYKGQIDIIPTDIVVWTVGTTPVSITNNLPFPKNDRSQIKINSKLQVEENPHVFALGDLVSCQDKEGNPLPATAQVAFQQSDYCAWNVWASLEEKPLLPFQYQPLGEMLALGSDTATLSGLGVSLDGGLAYFARRLVYLYRLPTVEHQLAVTLNWITNPISTLINSFQD
jgi:NADH dehydrogenase